MTIVSTESKIDRITFDAISKFDARLDKMNKKKQAFIQELRPTASQSNRNTLKPLSGIFRFLDLDLQTQPLNTIDWIAFGHKKEFINESDPAASHQLFLHNSLVGMN